MCAIDTGDVLVIGGGVVGCTTAYRLGQAGLGVTLVERAECGRGASWTAAGIVHPGNAGPNDPFAMMCRAGAARYEQFVSELREFTGIDPQFIKCGSLELITDDDQGTAPDSQVLSAAGELTSSDETAAERLSVDQTLALEPALTRKIHGSLYVRQAAQVRSPRLLAALRMACVHIGVRILEQTAVTDLIIKRGRVSGVSTSAGEFRAQHAVLAAGSWSSQIGARLAETVAVHPVRGQIVLLEHLPRPLEHIIQQQKNYLVCRLDGKILVGSTEESEAGYDKRNTQGGVIGLLQFAERFVPVLRDATWLRAWAGLRPATRDGKPYIGPVPGLEGLLAATGHFRSGLLLAPITADLITQLVTRGEAELDLEPFRPGR